MTHTPPPPPKCIAHSIRAFYNKREREIIAHAVKHALLAEGRIDYERDYGETITNRTVLVLPLGGSA